MKLLLLSNSTTQGYSWLEHAKENLRSFLGYAKQIAFVPYAGVSFSWDEYEAKANSYFSELGYKLISVHNFEDHRQAIKESDAIAVGGGNTFNLLKNCYDNGIIEAIRDAVALGKPYCGWSAGSNLACPSIKTTNDMPIIEPQSFEALNLIKFQINPHYTDFVQEGHFGETRKQRLEEFTIANPNIPVLAIPEGTMVEIIDNKIKYIGKKNAILLQHGEAEISISENDNINFLL